MSQFKEEREKAGRKILSGLGKGRIIYIGLPGEKPGDPDRFTNPMLMAPYGMFSHSPKTSTFVYGVASDTVTGNVHKIVFDTVEDVSSSGIELNRKGEIQAVISPLSEEEGMRSTWNKVKPMLFSPEAMEAYSQEIKEIL
tara:strand:+ start:1593 stop:2012 length:420 start_codon:yes stop_codon:yes gene_type:complete